MFELPLPPEAVNALRFAGPALAVIMMFFPVTRYLSQMIATIIHETGHAISVLPFGGRISGMKLQMNTSGEATVLIPQYGFPLYHIIRIINLLAGYSAPIYFTLLVIASVLFNWQPVQYVVLIIMALLILIFARNVFGFFVSIIFGGLTLLTTVVYPELLTPYLLLLASCSLISGIKDIIEVRRLTKIPSETKTTYVKDKRGRKVAQQQVSGVRTDFHIAASELTGTAPVWYWVFLIVHTPIWLTAICVMCVMYE